MIRYGGVRAILPIFNPMNDWIGKPVDGMEDFCGPVRISTDNEILGLLVEFDVSRANRQPTPVLANVILIVMPTGLQAHRAGNRGWSRPFLASFKSC